MKERVKAVIINQEFALAKYAVFSYEVSEGSMFPFCSRKLAWVFLARERRDFRVVWDMRKGKSVSYPHLPVAHRLVPPLCSVLSWFAFRRPWLCDGGGWGLWVTPTALKYFWLSCRDLMALLWWHRAYGVIADRALAHLLTVTRTYSITHPHIEADAWSCSVAGKFTLNCTNIQ